MDGGNAEIAGANFGRCLDGPIHRKRKEHYSAMPAGMPKFQEQISADAWMARYTGNEGALFGHAARNAEIAGANFGRCLDGPIHRKRKEHYSAMPAGMPKFQEQISAGGPEIPASLPVNLRSSARSR
jgi:hypothetical protein